jgi:histone-lysine N-methyltransferase SETMAR
VFGGIKKVRNFSRNNNFFIGIIHYEVISKGYCIWWDFQGIRQRWQIPKKDNKVSNMINKEVYAAQLQRLRQAIVEKRPFTSTVLFQHDNARPHTAAIVKDKIAEYGWELVPHPPYSPDLAPSDYHLFRSMKNWMRGKEYDDEAELVMDLNAYFASKDQSFFERGIHSLPDRWQLTIDYEGDYFVEG